MKPNKLSLIIALVTGICFLGTARVFGQQYTVSPSGNICGTTATLTMSGSQTGVTYQLETSTSSGLLLIGSPVNGTGSALTWSNVSVPSPNEYVVVNNTGTAVGITYLTPVLPITGNVTASNGGVLYPGGSVTLTANLTQGTAVSYQWFNNGPAISGATSSTYTATAAGSYSVLAITSSCGATMLTGPAVTAGTSPGPDCYQLNTTPGSANNYIISSTLRTPVTSATDAQLAAMGVCQVNQTIQYMDGLGRPIQTVQVKASPLGNDIVQPIAYDQYGRETTKYLPYVTPGSNNGAYRSSATGEQAVFYHPPGSASGSQQGNNIINTASPYAQTNFEPSPLNRVIEQGAPGDAWQPGSGTAGHTVKIAYGTNAAEVIMWSVNSNGNGATGTTAYAAGTLYKTTTTDENGNNTIEYKDLQGLVVCKMAQNGSAYLATYYVYDDLNNLTYVIPPIPVTTTYPTSFLETDPVFINFIYGYHYDSRNRLIQKKIPGKGWEYMVYNQLDQLVLSQDAVQHSNNQWTVTKYDAQGRVIVTGLWNDTSVPVLTQTTLQTNIYAGAQWDVRDLNNNSGVNPTGYVITSYPALTAPLKINYYDDYTFAGNPYSYIVNNQIPGMPATNSTMTRGLITATKTAVLNTITITNTIPDMLWTVTYYDDLGRTIQEDKQHYLGGTTNLNTANHDQISNGYNFTNAITNSIRIHYTATGGATPAVTIANSYVYDHEGRKKQTGEQINNGPNVLLVDDEYNEIGQLMTKNLHGVNGGGQGGQANITLSGANTSGTFTATNSITLSPGFSTAAGSTFTAQISGYLQTINYAYNERGWLLKINDPSVAPTTTSLFSEQLNYNNVAYGALPQFNGNIAEMDYNASTGGRQHVTYSYGPLNRLMAGSSSAGYSETNISYDAMGNLLGLARTAPNAAALKYSYADVNNNSTGNLLQNVTNTNNNTVIKSYLYDANGNAYSDGTNTLTYNMLNLPQTVSSTAYNIIYTYDADGTKLRKVSTQTSNGLVTTTDYISGIQYKTNSTVIDFIQTEEGRILNPITAPNYEYTLTDHLGNNRVTFDQLNGKTSEDDYYPFGLDAPKIQGTNLYLYNKKELQQELNEYDYGARFYDPVIARWMTVDLLAEISRRYSPYNYVENNPIRNIDPDGMMCDGCQTTFGLNGNDLQQENPWDQQIRNKTPYIGANDKGGPGPKIIPGANGRGPNDNILLPVDPKSNLPNITMTDDVVVTATRTHNSMFSGPDNGTFRDNPYMASNAELQSAAVNTGLLAGGEFFGPTLEGLGWLGRGAEGGRVFWSGGNVAKDAAAEFAGSNGMKTLEMTMRGRLMNTLSPYLPDAVSNPIWNNLSRSFAEGATGEAHLFTTPAGIRATSIWLTVEQPILIYNGVQIISHVTP